MIMKSMHLERRLDALAALTEDVLKTMCMGPRRGGFMLFQAPPSHSCTLGYLCSQKTGKLLLTLVLEDH